MPIEKVSRYGTLQVAVWLISAVGAASFIGNLLGGSNLILRFTPPDLQPLIFAALALSGIADLAGTLLGVHAYEYVDM